MEQRNPFEYVGANDLEPSMILDYYIEDFNYSRFIQSMRNVVLVGERGSGKSMTLLYNSLSQQLLKSSRAGTAIDLQRIGVYVPCNTPLTHKKECQLLNPAQGSALSEHYLVLSIAYQIAETLGVLSDILDGETLIRVRERLEFTWDAQLPQRDSLFTAIKDYIQKEILSTQRQANDDNELDAVYQHTFSFSSMIVPLLGILVKEIPKLRKSHFMLMIDDAHDLNPEQLAAVASWIAYRDHSLFSFKVAIANLTKTSLKTSSGGSILEGHDYIRLDLVQPFQNENSDFGRLAVRLIERRLRSFNITRTPDQFFPMGTQLASDLEEAERIVREEVSRKYPEDGKKISDFVHKYKRAYYFRSRPAHANRPEYSGFNTLVFLSTGVIRNLLQPCYWMYDKVLSIASGEQDVPIDRIPPSIQSEIILARSRALWDWLRDGLEKDIDGCSKDDARRAQQLLENLAQHFRERLFKHRSEPRANSFTVSGHNEELLQKLKEIFEILRKAQLLYVRSGSAKDAGKREWYYVPNRMLWPDKGLDPHGQHARVSLSITALWASAEENVPIPFRFDDKEGPDPAVQEELF